MSNNIVFSSSSQPCVLSWVMVNSVPGTAAGQLIRENCVLSREKEREQSKSHLLKDEIFKIKKKPT